MSRVFSTMELGFLRGGWVREHIFGHSYLFEILNSRQFHYIFTKEIITSNLGCTISYTIIL